MKKTLIIAFCAANVLLNAQTTETVSVGTSYANDVYYSLANGVIKTEPRNNWHIAFTTKIVDASILINEGLGVELYLASTNLNDWATLDTAGLTLVPLHNSPATWTEGAFNANASGHPNYGWGIYNNITHNVSGTSIYILKMPDASLRKIAIDAMKTNGDFELRIANLDGTNQQSKVFNKMAYNTKNFFYWDVANDILVDREPVKTTWDILFTRYMEEVIPGSFYPVVGAIMNIDVNGAKAAGVDTNTVDWNNYTLTDSITTIGSNWKSFNNSTFMWALDDSLAFFVHGLDGNLYKLVFKTFGGSANGDISFSQSIASAMDVAELSANKISIYPNPSSDFVVVEADADGEAQLFTITGQLAGTSTISSGRNTIDVSTMQPGHYVLMLTINGKTLAHRLVIR
jgi:hypothetical protein